MGFSWQVFNSINNSSATGRVGEQMRCGGKARSAELLEGVLCCALMAKPQHQYVAQSTEQPLEKDEIRASDVSSPRDDSRELPQDPLSCPGLLPPCCPGFSLHLSMRFVCIIFMFTLLPLRETGHLHLCFSHHTWLGGSIGTCARRGGTCCC